MESIYDKYLKSGELTTCHFSDTNEYANCISVYTVVRIIGGIPLFLDQHLNRFLKSVELLGRKIIVDIQDINKKIFNLSLLNDAPDGNIKIIAHYRKTDIFPAETLIYFIKHNYPKENAYKTGINTLLFHAEREIPNVKIVNRKLRNETNKAINRENISEVILIDNNGNITEGSRSNIFFVSGNKVLTAPESDVLKGITRGYVIDICNELNIEIYETKIECNSLIKSDAAFITGTSPKVMPVRRIDHYNFDVDNVILRKIMIMYDVKISNYLRDIRQKTSQF